MNEGAIRHSACKVCVWHIAEVLYPTRYRHFGPIPAGFPSPAQGYEDDPLDLHELLVQRPAATFF